MRNRLATGGVVTAILLAAWWLWPTSGKLPHQVFDDMKFSADFDDVNAETVCHQIILRHADGKQEKIVSHTFLTTDFGKMSLADKQELLRRDTRADMEKEGLACIGSDGRPFLSDAYAQSKHCPDCTGGCNVTSCAAHLDDYNVCQITGHNCVITVICCGQCPPGC